jgi:hypothetical protein
MIYERVPTDDPIRQGDIFRNIPRVDFSLSSLAVLFNDEEDPRQMTWRDAVQDAGSSGTVTAIVPIKSVDGIVITQDCDAVRAEYVYLCEVVNFMSATGGNPPSTAKKWQSKITQMARTNHRLFYLPSAS